MYEADYPLYRQYKYWETADKDWFEADNFRILVNRYHENDVTVLRMVPQRKGLPSVEQGYINAAQKTAFSIIAADCSSSSAHIFPSQAPKNGRKIDRFFFQNADLSISVAYSCRKEKPNQGTLAAEAQKWSLATRTWTEIGDVNAAVDSLPVDGAGIHQIRVRLFGGTERDNKRLARRLILDACEGSPDFKILFDEAATDVAVQNGVPQPVSSTNVRIYGFVCRPVK